MELNLIINRYKHTRYNFHKWRYELDYLNKIGIALIFACLTGLLAQFRFYLPWTLVPITGQTFAVMLSAIFLGKWAGVSQGMYVGFGAAGVPWFAGWNSGLGAITGITAGYLFGFIIAAFFMGYFIDKYVRSRSFVSMVGIMLFANFVIIYGFGLANLYLWLTLVNNTSVGIIELLMMGMIPFIIGDLLKIFIAAGIARAVIPKRAYNGEVDAGSWKSWPLP
jgi:biotin transport system substrate-specific component